MNKERLPIDTDTKIYIENWEIRSLNDLIVRSQQKWGLFVSLDDLKIDFEEIQVKCFGYDQYDPSDYKFYFVITLDAPISV